MAAVLGSIVGHDFRLAGSGSQHGKDGGTPAGVVFEAKRYDAALPASEILIKIADLITLDKPPDLWILGATVGVKTQLADKAALLARRGAVAVQILDWPATSRLPPLALVCAMAREETCAFLRTQLGGGALVQAAETALRALTEREEFAERAARLRADLRASGVALANALRANHDWLRAVFEDRRRARAAFGQALAPAASHASPTTARPALTRSLLDALSEAASGDVLALTGTEGAGKSWAFAQSWLQWDRKALTVLIPASAFRPEMQFGPPDGLILSWLAEQTQDGGADVAVDRWRRRLGTVHRQPGDPVRLVVCIDGLNERPDFNWPPWIDGAAAWLAERGGVLVVTSRRRFFDDRIRRSLLSAVRIVPVPEWSAEEVDAIVAARGVDPTQVAPAVRKRLRNPRILGIAFELLDTAELRGFTELSVDQLLFEHIRRGTGDAGVPETAADFAHRLARHAQEIIARIHRQASEDRLVFERQDGGVGGDGLTSALLAVTGEHFFRPLPEDPALYTLTDDGLILALGLSVIKALQKAERRDGDLAEALQVLLEPIAALDKTAEAVFAAAVVASLDSDCTGTLRRALVAGLLRLQNLDGERFGAFVGIVRNAPAAATGAMYDLTTTAPHAPHAAWLIDALREARDQDDVWAIVSGDARLWLGIWSEAPELGVFTRSSDNAEQHASEVAARRLRLSEREANLSEAERAFRTRHMTLREGFDPAPLYSAALALIAGRPLAPFAEALIACAYAMSFNSSLGAPHDELLALIRFNPQDWSETRARLLSASAFAHEAEASNTARWMRVEILRGAATAADAEEEHALVEVLTADRERWTGGRLVERYCAADPCDPAAREPDNIAATAERYEALSVETLSATRFSGEADHFFDDARPGLARFRPGIAAAVHRDLAMLLPGRDTLGRWLGVTTLRPHAVLLEGRSLEAVREVACARPVASAADEHEELREDGLSTQIALMQLLPHLDGRAQVELLLALPNPRSPVLELAHAFHPAPPEAVERLLSAAAAASSHELALIALLYVRGAAPVVSEGSAAIIRGFTKDGRSSVRALALALLAQLGDEIGLRAIVEAGWHAGSLTGDELYFERWYGSQCLIRAAELGLIAPAEVIDRTLDEVHADAVRRLGEPAAAAVVPRVRAAVMKLLEASPEVVSPPVEQDDARCGEAPLYSLGDLSSGDSRRDFVAALKETPDEFQEKQRSAWKAFEQVRTALARSDAELAVKDVGAEVVDAFASSDLKAAVATAEAILANPPALLPALVNFGLRLAVPLSRAHPDLAEALIERLEPVRALVKLNIDQGRLSLAACSAWMCARHPALDAMRIRRLDQAPNDHALAQEVLAALRAGLADELLAYAEACLAEAQPTRRARGLAVLGFGPQSPLADELIRAHETEKGLTGAAARAARYAYERNVWARQWYAAMAAVDEPLAFWSASVQLLKIVDARISTWAPEAQRGELMNRFGFTLKAQLKRRIGLWRDKREAKLFGQTPPADIFRLRA